MKNLIDKVLDVLLQSRVARIVFALVLGALLFFVSTRFAQAECPEGFDCNFVQGGCGSVVADASEVRLHDGTGCVAAGSSIRDGLLAKYPACSEVCVEYDPENCKMFVGFVYDCGTGLNSTSLSSVATTTVTEVPIGTENAAAETAYDAWMAVEDFPPAPEGFTRTSGMSGFTADVVVGEGNTSNVKASMWKYGGYSKNGTVVPLEGIEISGGSGGGLTQDEMMDAVSDGVGNAITDSGLDNFSGELIGANKQAMIDAFEHAFNQGWIGPGEEGGGGGGASAEEVETALDNALNTKFPAGTFEEESPDTSDFTHDSFTNSKTFGNSFTDFSSDFKESALYNGIGHFFEGAPTSGSPGVITLNGGTLFGQIEFNMNIFSNALSILRAIVLVIFGFVSVKVVILKGGGG